MLCPVSALEGQGHNSHPSVIRIAAAHPTWYFDYSGSRRAALTGVNFNNKRSTLAASRRNHAQLPGADRGIEHVGNSHFDSRVN
jgi:hypothetical protein